MTTFDAISAGSLEGTWQQQIAVELQALQEQRKRLKEQIAAQQQQCSQLLGLGSLFSHPFIASVFLFELPKHRERHLLAIQRQNLYLNAGRLNRCLLCRDLALAIAAHLSSSTRANSERTLLGRQFRLVSFYLFTRNLSGLFANAGILLKTL